MNYLELIRGEDEVLMVGVDGYLQHGKMTIILLGWCLGLTSTFSSAWETSVQLPELQSPEKHCCPLPVRPAGWRVIYLYYLQYLIYKIYTIYTID